MTTSSQPPTPAAGGAIVGRQDRPVIVARGVERTYRLGSGDDGAVVRALRGVDLAVHTGEFIALVGPSGCGKSTLLHLLGLLDVPDVGEIEVLGRTAKAGTAVGSDAVAALRRQGLAYIFQSFHLLPGASALENVELPLVYRGVPADERRRRATAALVRVGLGDKLKNTPAQLSGGQQQRVAIARALVVDPTILLADEPTGNLDSTTSSEIVALLRELHQTMGLTVIIVTHDPELARGADRVVHLKDGAVEQDVLQHVADVTPPPPAPRSRSRPLLVLGMAIMSALRSIGRTKLRSALTLLGVMFGIGAVVVTSALGEGARLRLEQQLATLGTHLLTVQPGPPPDPSLPRLRLDDDDVAAVREEVKGIKALAPTIGSSVTVIKDNKSLTTRGLGTTLEYLDARSWTVEEGTAWGVDDEGRAARVCILGRTVADALFPDGGAVGESVRVGRMPCEVTGVLEQKGVGGMGQDQDDTILVPLLTMRRRIEGRGGHYVDGLSIAAVDDAALPQVQREVTALILSRKKARSDDALRVMNMADLLKTLDAQRQAITMLLLAVALVSLLVGGIGVMNIMLVSVTERTREIGMRLAIGARRTDVRLQFLVESVALTVVGGVIGLFLGVIGAELLTRYSDYRAAVQLESALQAFVISAVIGVVFGLLPAERAARLTPSLALRHE
jgi:macrolide transport system ATP-binding/permease protein